MRQAIELLILLMACAACFAVGLLGRSWIGQQPDRTKPFADLLEAAEEMYGYFGSSAPKWEEWKAAIEAAKAELERGKR